MSVVRDTPANFTEFSDAYLARWARSRSLGAGRPAGTGGCAPVAGGCKLGVSGAVPGMDGCKPGMSGCASGAAGCSPGAADGCAGFEAGALAEDAAFGFFDGAFAWGFFPPQPEAAIRTNAKHTNRAVALQSSYIGSSSMPPAVVPR